VASLESCRKAVGDSVPARFRDINLSAFDEGYAYGKKVLESGPIAEETDGNGKEELESAD
jgi:Pyruvate/2-oxoacid:ferredoxin oxidoreductase gamma subunit